MRRLSERARLEGMLALRKALDGVRRPQVPARATDFERVARSDPELAVVPDGDDDLVDEPAYEVAARDAELMKGLDRIADSIERVAAQLDSYHQERAEHLDAIEFLLREMVIGSVPSPANRPVVLGGVIEREIDDGEREISLVVDDVALAVDEVTLAIDAAVEVRSRFHDRWIGGFTIAETVNTPGRRRYRLTRRSDGIPLPILFDACDVRAAEDAFSRQHAPS
jgi:hypothetical protein